MSKTLYIIGNGFDRFHTLDTRYGAFAFFLQNYHPDIYDLLIQYFGLPDLDPDDSKSIDDPLWSDFENALADLDFETVLDDNMDYVASPSSPDFRDSDWHSFQIQMEMIGDKLTKDLRKAFREFILNVDFPDLADHMLLTLEPGAIFLNFNYTDTLEKYYHIPRKNIVYIHGKALISDDNIVLGHGRHPEEFKEASIKEPEGLSPEELYEWREHMADQYDFSFESGKEQLMSYFNDSFKSTGEIIAKRKSFFETLAGIKDIFVLGHSLALVDLAYFRKVVESVHGPATWHVTYFNDEELHSHMETLTSLGLQKEQIKIIRIDSLKRHLPSLF